MTGSPGPGESECRGTTDSGRAGKGGLTAFSGSSGRGRVNEASGLGVAGSFRVAARPDGQPVRTPEEGGEAARKPSRHFRPWTGPGPWGESRRVGRTWAFVGGLGDQVAGRVAATRQARPAGDGGSQEGAGLNLKSGRPKGEWGTDSDGAGSGGSDRAAVTSCQEYKITGVIWFRS